MQNLSKLISTIIKLNKREDSYRNLGAMFGLDARIALVIFAILGAIISYYGKNRINEAQVASILKQIDSIRLAFKANIADNGSISMVDNSTSAINEDGSNSKLIDNSGIRAGKQNYNYIQAKYAYYDQATNKDYHSIKTPLGNILLEYGIFSSDNSTGQNIKITDCDGSKSQCYYWIKLLNVPNEYYSEIENYYDQSTINALPDNVAHTSGTVIKLNGNAQTCQVAINIGRRQD